MELSEDEATRRFYTCRMTIDQLLEGWDDKTIEDANELRARAAERERVDNKHLIKNELNLNVGDGGNEKRQRRGIEPDSEKAED
jgi:hypothetical protein